MQTFGWDTVFVIRNDRVNDALAKNLNLLLPTFSIQLDSDPIISASGNFLSWRIVEGGADKLLYLKLTIDKGKLTIGDFGMPDHVKALSPELAALQGATDVAIDGVAIVVSLFLRVLPKPDTSTQELAFFLEQVAYASGDSGRPGFVTVVNVIDPSGKLSSSAKTLLGAAIAEYLVLNAKQIAFAFASINLVPPGTNTWLTPVASDYAYLEKIGAGSGYMAVLSVTTPRPIDNLPRTIDPNAILGDFTGSFVISEALFLKNVILPFLPTAYQAPSTVFYLDEAARAIRNHGPFETIPVKSGAIVYHPVITGLSVSMDGEGLATTVEGRCDLKAGINMTFGISTRNRSSFNPAFKSISFLPDPNPQSRHSADIPWYFWFLGPLAVLITELVVKLISDSIASQLDALARDALSIARNPPQSVQWTGAHLLDTATAGVNGAFFMMGNV